MSLAILLATFNGEKFIQEQLDSLYNQTFLDWKLYVHDDGSTDETLNILHNYALRHNNMEVMEYNSSSGAMENFLSMLLRVEADYYMFSDQDDVWHKDKVEVTIEKMQECEKKYLNIPIIVHCDLRVVDENLKLINESYWRYSGVKPGFITNFKRLGVGNFVTGCTMMFNSKAKQAMLKPTPQAYMHDAWITACVIKKHGRVERINTPLIDYRQHDTNSIGALSVNRLNLRYRISHFKQMYRLNKRHFLMLKSIGYYSIFTFILNKILYKLYNEVPSANQDFA